MRKPLILTHMMTKGVLMLVCIMTTLGILSVPGVEAYQLPDTGQTKCYGDTNRIWCPQPGEAFYGQDAEYQGPQPAYQDNGDGTVTDLNTGLIWQQDGYLSSGSCYDCWAEARDFCANLELGGRSDWRLPSRYELLTIVDYGKIFPGPMFNTQYFTNTYWDWHRHAYWTGEVDHGDYPWYVSFGDGRSNSHMFKRIPFSARCVCGNVLPSSSYIDNVDGTVTDINTGIMWQRADDNASRTWEDALAYCEGLTVAGFNDWRLPNILELGSINYRLSSSELLKWRMGQYWSSTTSASGSDSAYYEEFDHTWIGTAGTIASNPKSSSSYVRCVREGRVSPVPIPDPPVPDPICPANNADLLKYVTFEWSPIDIAIGYELQVDNDCEFKSPEIDTYYAGTTISEALENFLPDGTYCWRVRAKYGEDFYSPWSNPSHFTFHLPTASTPFWVPLYRLYKGTGDSDHFYTINAVERDQAVASSGYTYERIECSISSVKGPGMVPLFRLYVDRGDVKDHLYTTIPAERDKAIADAARPYKYEGIAGFVYPSPQEGAVALFRLFNRTTVDHFYCTRASERDYAMNTSGYEKEGNQEGALCYVMPAESPVPLSHGRPSGFYGSTNTAVGAYIYSHTDLSFPSPGPAIRFERSYNSRSTVHGILGVGWSHNYDWHIYQDDNSYIVHRGSGRMDYYDLSFNPLNGGVYDTLVRKSGSGHEGELLLTTLDKAEYTFGTLRNSRQGFFLKEIKDRYGNVLTLTYQNDKLAEVKDPVNRKITFEYDAYGNLWGIGDPQLARSLLFSVNNQTKNLVSSTDWKGNVTQYVYEQNTDGTESHRIKQIIRPGGKVLVTNEYVEDRLVKQYDALNNPTGVGYPPSGDAGTATVSAPLGYHTVYENDGQYRVIKMTDPRGSSVQSAYDDNHTLTGFKNRRGHDSAFEYASGKGSLTKTTHVIEGGDTVTTRFDYNKVAFPSFATSFTDAMDRRTEYEYDASGSVIAVKDPMVLANPGVSPVRREYYSDGQVWKVTDKLGRTTEYFYEDEHKNLTRVKDPLGAETQYAYDGVGRRISTTNARGYTTQYEYDPNDNVVKVIDALGRQVFSMYDSRNLLIRTVDANLHATEFGYDDKGQQTSRKDSNGHTATYAYDALGRRTSATDQAGRTTGYEYDGNGNLVKITTPAGTTITFEYDENGNLEKTIDARGKQTQNQYSVMDQLTKTVDPLTLATQYTYQKDGNINTRQDAKGLQTHYSYDVLGQLVRIDYAGDPGASIAFEYYENSNLKKLTDPAGVTTYIYDGNDRLVSVTDPHGKTVSYGYDMLGNRTGITYPGNKTVNYEYDAVNRLTKVTDWLGGEISYTYDAAGNLSLAVYPNGNSTEYSYDSANRLTSLVHKRGDGSILCSYSYTLDPVGNITHVAVNEPLMPIYQAGNNTHTHDDGNRLISDGQFSYTYDNNGNMIQRSGSAGTTSFTYNHENLLTGISGAEFTILNVYNGIGQRIARTYNGTQTRYVLDVAASLPSVLAETDGSGAVKAYYVHGLGLISRITPTGLRQIYHYNNRGDAIALTDSSGVVTDSYAYDEFGQVLNRAGSTSNRFTFVGKFGVMDEDNGFYFMRARYYEAGVGRFLSKDPTVTTVDQYSYSYDNPLLFVDPNGEDAVILLAPSYKVKGIDVGHIAIAVRGNNNWFYFSVGSANDTTKGITPEKYSGSMLTIDTAHNQNITELVKSVNISRKDKYSKFLYLKLSKASDNQMFDYVNRWYLNGEDNYYKVASNNCKDFVMNILGAGGVKSKEYMTPNKYFSHLLDDRGLSFVFNSTNDVESLQHTQHRFDEGNY